MENPPLRKLTVSIENENKEDVVIIFTEPSLKDVEELIKDEGVMKIVTDCICNEKKEGVEEVDKEKRKGEDFWLEMFEKERVDKVVKKEVEEEKGKKVWNVILENKMLPPRMERTTEPTPNLDQEISKIVTSLYASKQAGSRKQLDVKKDFTSPFDGENMNQILLKQKNLDFTGKVEPSEFLDVILHDQQGLFPETKKIKKRKKKQPSQQSYSCDICLKTFTMKQKLTRHTLSHTRPFSCEICGKAFATKHRLDVHTGTHSDDRPYACDVCDKTFTGSSLLLIHKKLHGEKKVTCEICGKLFIDKKRLTLHLRVHTKEKPYSCELCGKAFSRNHHLDRHVKTHTGEKPYSCDVCGKLFSQKVNLNVHQIVHTDAKPYSCECGKTFPFRKSLDTHKIEVHNEDIPDTEKHMCDVCERPFASIGRLKRHKMTHTGERPYACGVCGRAFTLESNLRVHMKMHSETKKEII